MFFPVADGRQDSKYNQTHHKLGEFSSAIERGIELKPDDFAIQQTLGRLQAVMNKEG